MEVHVGLLDEPDHHAAALEAQRCFSCGVCNTCDRCVDHCPEGILMRDGSGYRFNYDYCKGCGICATECPRGVVIMSELQ
jgi:Pyruvate/2-oxoacid:ferredoxin oxidoreductase delta subunit